MTRDQVSSFVFSGILARHAISDMEATGLLRDKPTRANTKSEHDLFAPVQESIRRNSARMLFVLENTVREFIDTRLSEVAGAAWFEARAPRDMKKKLADRQDKEARNHWHMGRQKQPLFYMDFGDLAKVITTNWTDFQDLLPSQPWVQSRLDDAERTRNVIAHTNVLAAEEEARLELSVRDWIRQIG